MDTNFIKSDSTFRALDGVNTLLMSETRVMETVLQSKYQCMKTGDVGFLLEGISDMSEIIKESSNDFVQEIGDFQKNVNSQMTELIKRHDKITAYHILDKVDHVNFTFAGYNFKTLSTKRINLFELDNMVSDYNNLLDRLVSSVDDLDELDNIETELQYYLEEMYLSKIRARTLGVSRSIYTDDFIDYVKEYYRGSVTPVNISVDKDYIKSIQKEKNNLIKDRDATIKEFACALRTFENFSRYLTMTLNDLTKSDSDHTIALSMSRNTAKGTLSARLCTIHVTDPQSLYKITTILRLVYSRMVKLQSIVHVILSERLNALKDQASQDIQVLNNLKTYADRKSVV